MDFQCFLPVYPNFELQQISPDFLSKTIIALLLLTSRLERIFKKKKVSYSNWNFFGEHFPSVVSSFPLCLISVWKCFVISVLLTWCLLQASINCEHDSPWCMSFLIQWQVHFPILLPYISPNLQDCQDELGRNSIWICFLQKCQYLLKQRAGSTPMECHLSLSLKACQKTISQPRDGYLA